MDNSVKIKIRDEKKVYNEVCNPAVVYDIKSGLLKIGEKEEMEYYFNKTNRLYRQCGLHDIANDLYLMELPKDQEIVDKVFQIHDYVLHLHKQIETTAKTVKC